jgi:hypothetical protein
MGEFANASKRHWAEAGAVFRFSGAELPAKAWDDRHSPPVLRISYRAGSRRDYSVFVTVNPVKKTYLAARAVGARGVPYVGTQRRNDHHDQCCCCLCRILRCGLAVDGVTLHQRGAWSYRAAQA